MQTTDQRILAYLGAEKRAAPHQIMEALGISKKTLYVHLAQLRQAGKVVKIGTKPDVVYVLGGSEAGDGREIKPGTAPQQLRKSTEPPLVDIKVTNPVTYLKLWWKRVMGNEGVDIRFRIRPLTALALAAMIAGVGFGVGRFSLPAESVIVKYVPQLGPTPSPDPWKETAFSGTLRYTVTGKRYYLTTGEGEAITLQVPDNVNLAKLVGRRIFATGKYNTLSGVVVVAEAEDLEILPAQVVPVPTTSDVVPMMATSSATSQ